MTYSKSRNKHNTKEHKKLYESEQEYNRDIPETYVPTSVQTNYIPVQYGLSHNKCGDTQPSDKIGTHVRKKRAL